MSPFPSNVLFLPNVPFSFPSQTDYLSCDGMQIVLDFHKTGSGSVALQDRYLWGPQVDQLLTDEQVTSLTSAGTVYWSFANQRGARR